MKTNILISRLMILIISFSFSVIVKANNWQQVLDKAKGQNVYFHYWGGSEAINNYLKWATKEIQKRYGVKLRLIKIVDPSFTVKQMIAEKIAKTKKIAIDLIWINGENFYTLKQNKLLYGPFVSKLPSSKNIDLTKYQFDFGIPVDGLEAPWGRGIFVFINNTNKIKQQPKNYNDLLIYLTKHKGKFTYPKPPAFHGTSFLKQIIWELTPENKRNVFYHKVNEQKMKEITKPLWKYLNNLHPLLWRSGKVFPNTQAEMLRLLNQNIINIAISFNPNEVANLIKIKQLTKNFATYIHTKTLTNTHFLAINKNSKSIEGTKVVINFLLSIKAQLKKANLEIWGDPTVLNLSKINKQDISQLKKQQSPQTLKLIYYSKTFNDFTIDWTLFLEKEWQKRY